MEKPQHLIRTVIEVILIGLLVSATAGLPGRDVAISLTRWGWLFALMYLTHRLLSIQLVRGAALQFRALYGRTATMSYILIGICFASLGVVYWFGINKTYERFLVQEQPTATNPIPPTPSSSSVFDSTVAKWRLDNQPDHLELHDLFLIDFRDVQQNTYGAIFVDDGQTINVQYGINVDLASRSKFLTFYVGRQDLHTAEICAYLADHYQFILDKAPQLFVEQKTPGDSGTISTGEAIFSRRIYIYHETYLPDATRVELTNLFTHRGLSVILRSTDYLSNKKLEAQLQKLRKNSGETTSRK